MSNFSTITPLIPAYCGTNPQYWSASTNDDLSALLVTGYLNDRAIQFKSNDVFLINYSDASVFPLNPGEDSVLGTFRVIVGGGNTSLVQDTITPTQAITGTITTTTDLTNSGDPVYGAVWVVHNTGSVYTITLPDPAIYPNFSCSFIADFDFYISSHCNIVSTNNRPIGGPSTVTFRWSDSLTVISDGNVYQVLNAGTTALLSQPVYIDNSGNVTGVGEITASGNNNGSNFSSSFSNLATGSGSGSILRLITTSDITGATGGSPYISYEQTNFARWSTGIYSVDDGGDNLFHIAPGNFGSGDPVVVQSGPNKLIVNGDQLVNGNVEITGVISSIISSNPGSSVNFWTQNTSTAAGSHAQYYARVTSNVGGTVGGSAFTQYAQENYQCWGTGIWSGGDGGDNKFHISNTGPSFFNFSSIDAMILDGSGNMSLRNGTGKITAINTPYEVTLVLFAGGSATQTVAVAGMVSGDKVFAQMRASTNVAVILSVVESAGQYVITFNVDPGACNYNIQAYH